MSIRRRARKTAPARPIAKRVTRTRGSVRQRRRIRRAPVAVPSDRPPVFSVLAALQTNYRLWAKLPAAVHVLLALAAPAPGESPLDEQLLGAVHRPAFPRGVCRACGCSHHDPCAGGCGWADAAETVCTACVATGQAVRP